MRFGNVVSFIVVWFHLNRVWKSEGDCFGRLRERRIWLTCVQPLFLPFLYVIWSTPTNVMIIRKPLDKCFLKFDNLEINRHLIWPSKFQGHWKHARQLNKASNVPIFPLQILCLQVSVLHYGQPYCFHLWICTCTTCIKSGHLSNWVLESVFRF